MLFECLHGILACEDFVARSVSPILYSLVLCGAVWQGGVPVVLGIGVCTLCFLPAIVSFKMGGADAVLCGAYLGLLLDPYAASLFLTLSGGLGVLWYTIMRTSIPMITMMGFSYSAITAIKWAEQIKV